MFSVGRSIHFETLQTILSKNTTTIAWHPLVLGEPKMSYLPFLLYRIGLLCLESVWEIPSVEATNQKLSDVFFTYPMWTNSCATWSRVSARSPFFASSQEYSIFRQPLDSTSL